MKRKTADTSAEHKRAAKKAKKEELLVPGVPVARTQSAPPATTASENKAAHANGKQEEKKQEVLWVVAPSDNRDTPFVCRTKHAAETIALEKNWETIRRVAEDVVLDDEAIDDLESTRADPNMPKSDKIDKFVEWIADAHEPDDISYTVHEVQPIEMCAALLLKPLPKAPTEEEGGD